MNALVEVYRRCPDCEICGQEITIGREQYKRGRRVCCLCKEGLEANDRSRREARANQSLQRRNRIVGTIGATSGSIASKVERHVLRKSYNSRNTL